MAPGVVDGGWEELFSGAHGGRPYYFNAATGVTQWAEPSEHRLEQEAVDAAVFGLEVGAVRRVMAPLRTMQSHPESWTAARAVLLRVLGNLVGQPGVEKFRSVKNCAGSTFQDLVYAKPGGKELMRAVGFVEQNGGPASSPDATVTLPPLAPLEPCRLAHSHVERSANLTGGAAAAQGGRWGNPIHVCSSCASTIVSGEERVWTTRWDAPRGEFRYRCNQCRAPEYNLCEARNVNGKLSCSSFLFCTVLDVFNGTRRGVLFLSVHAKICRVAWRYVWL